MTKRDKLHIEYCEILKKITIPNYEWLQLDKLLYSEIYYVLLMNDSTIDNLHSNYINNKLYNLDYLGSCSRGLYIFYFRNRVDRDEYCQRIGNIVSNYCDTLMIKETLDEENSQYDNVTRAENLKIYNYLYELISQIPNTKHRAYLAAYMVFQYRYFISIKKYLENRNVVICYFDGGKFENIAIQYTNYLNKATISLQHGQPIFKGIENDRINQAQILNLNSKYFIAANPFTKQEFLNAGVSEKRIKIIGMFKKNRTDNDFDSKKFGVFLNALSLPNAIENNIELVCIAEALCKEYGYNYFIKPHPSDNADRYLDFLHKGCTEIKLPSEKIENITDNICFSLCHESSVYIDLYANGYKPFVWKRPDETHFITNNTDDYFGSIEELIEGTQKWLALSNYEKIKFIESRLNELTNYQTAPAELKKFIREILEDKNQ